MKSFVAICKMVKDNHPRLYNDNSTAGHRHDVANRRRIVKYWLTDWSGMPLWNV